MLYPLSYEGGAPTHYRPGRHGATPRHRRAGPVPRTVSAMDRVLPADVDDAFALLADLRGHDRWIPLTTVAAPSRLPHVGDVVEARTAGFFVDRMRVLEVDPPRLLRLAKIGPVLFGEASIEVVPLTAGTCRVRWSEHVHLRGPLPRVTEVLLRPVLAVMTWLALRTVERWLRAQRPAEGRPTG